MTNSYRSEHFDLIHWPLQPEIYLPSRFFEITPSRLSRQAWVMTSAPLSPKCAL